MPERQKENAMANGQVDRTVVTQDGPEDAGSTVRSSESRTTTSGPGGSEMTRRIVMLLFGLVQLVIGLRFVLLLVNAREANGLVSGILNLSQVFVAPFEGILRTNGLSSQGSFFDYTAIVAIVGWTILEFVILWAVGIFRRQQTV
jgi:YGGT family